MPEGGIGQRAGEIKGGCAVDLKSRDVVCEGLSLFQDECIGMLCSAEMWGWGGPAVPLLRDLTAGLIESPKA